MSVNQYVISKKLSVGGISSDDLTLSLQGIDGILLPSGTTAERPTSSSLLEAVLRYNNTDSTIEWYDGSQWVQPSTSSYVLPTASTSILGGVKVDGTTVTIDGSGVISASVGSTVSFGTDNQIPFMNATNDDFEYSANLIYNGSLFGVIGTNAQTYFGDNLTAHANPVVTIETDDPHTGPALRVVQNGNNLFEVSPLGALFSEALSDGTGTARMVTVNNGTFGYQNIPTSPTGAALTKTDDTNVTLTLGGSPTTALLNAASLTLGWTGQLSLARGGTGANLTDPNANTLMGWDDTDGAVKFITIGSNLSYDHTTHTLSATGGGSLPSLTQHHIYVGDGTSAPTDAGTGAMYDGTTFSFGAPATPLDPLHVNGGLRITGASSLTAQALSGVFDFASSYTRITTFGGNNTTAGGFNILQYSANKSVSRTGFSLGADGSITMGVGNVSPVANDGAALGTTTKMWSDIFFADGGVINWNNGDVTLTHSANALTLSGGNLFISNLATGLTAPTMSGTTKMVITDSNGLLSFADIPSGGGGLADAYTSMTDGTNTAISSGTTTFKFRSANSILSAVVTNDDVTHGDNLLLTINQSNITGVGTITSGTWHGTAIADTYISSASTWNAKQNAITLTTIGTSGAATFSSNTLNIPNYTYTLPTASTSTLGGVKVDGSTITITGGVISAVGGGSGSVTSVGASISGALGVTGSPITTSGTLAFAWQGASSQYVRGDGSLVSIPSTPGIDTVLAVGESLTADRTIGGAFNLGISAGTLSIGSASISGSANLYVSKSNDGLGVFITKSGFPVTTENSFALDGQRLVGNGTFSGTNSVLGVYGELGFNSGDFIFSGPKYTSLSGVNGVVTIYSGGGSITAGVSMFAGGQYNIFLSGTGTVDKFACLRAMYPVLVPSQSFSGTITNHYGLFIDDTTNSSETSHITNRWGVYQEGASDPNYFGGNVTLNKMSGTGNADIVASSTGLLVRRSKTPQALTDGATITWDITSGYNASVTLAGNRTLSISNAAAGDRGTLVVTQDATGSRTLTVSSGKSVNGGGTALYLSTAASSIDIVEWYYDGSTFFFWTGTNFS